MTTHLRLPAALLSLSVLALGSATQVQAGESLAEACSNAGYFGGAEIARAEVPAAGEAYADRDWQGYLSAFTGRWANDPNFDFKTGQLAAAAWVLLMAPAPEAGATGYRYQRDTVAAHFHQWFLTQQQSSGRTMTGDAPTLTPITTPIFPVDSFLEDAVIRPIETYTPAEIEFSRKKIALARAGKRYQEENIAKLMKHAPHLCAFHGGALYAKSCAAGLRKLVEDMRPYKVAHTLYGQLEIYEEFLTNPLYARALPRLALRIKQRIAAAERSEPELGDFFTDSLHAFQAVEPDARKARDATWKWMGIYSTRGASFGGLMLLLHDRQLALGLAALDAATGLSYLDELRFRSRQPAYSLPPEVRSKCFYGKPYHFWMSAYFSYKLRSEGHSRWPSVLASYFTGAFYEFGSTTNGRSPTRALNESSRSSYVKWMKVNLYFDAIGSRHGSDAFDRERRVKPGFNADSALEDLLESRGGREASVARWPMSEQWAQYLYWTTKFEPFALLRDVLTSP